MYFLLTFGTCIYGSWMCGIFVCGFLKKMRWWWDLNMSDNSQFLVSPQVRCRYLGDHQAHSQLSFWSFTVPWIFNFVFSSLWKLFHFIFTWGSYYYSHYKLVCIIGLPEAFSDCWNSLVKKNNCACLFWPVSEDGGGRTPLHQIHKCFGNTGTCAASVVICQT